MTTSGINCQPLLQMRKLRQQISYPTPSVQIISARHSTEALEHLCSAVCPYSEKEGCSEPGMVCSWGHAHQRALCQSLPGSQVLQVLPLALFLWDVCYYLRWRIWKMRLIHIPRVPPWGSQRSRGARGSHYCF